MNVTEISTNAAWGVRAAWRRHPRNIVFVKRGTRRGWRIKVIDVCTTLLRLRAQLELDGWALVERE